MVAVVCLALALHLSVAYAQDAAAPAPSETPSPVIEVAPPPQYKILTLGGDGSSYDLLPYTRVFEDKSLNFRLSKVLAEYRSGNGTTPVGTIHPGYTSSAYWIVFTVNNNHPSKSQWFLDLGGTGGGVTGTADRLALFADDTPSALLIDGRHIKNKLQIQGQEKNALPLTVDPGKTRTYALYIEPTHSLAMNIAPRIKDQAQFQTDRSAEATIETSLAALLALFSLALLFMHYRHRNAIYWLLPAYVVTEFLIYRNGSEIVSQGNNTGVVYLDLLSGLSAILALMLTQRIFFARDSREEKTPPPRLLPSIATGVGLVAAAGLISDAAAMYTTPMLLRFAPLLLPVIVLVALPAARKDTPQKFTYALAWVIALLGGIAGEVNAKGLISLPANTYWLFFTPHILILSFASLRYIRISQARRRQKAAEEARRLEDEMEFRKTRELSDQTRLLGVLQREKELITDLRNREAERAQALRQAKEAAEDADKAKTEFLAIISHEIRTPMTGIMGMIRMLMDTQLDGKQKEHVSTLHYAGEALLALLNDILDYSKASAGKIVLESIDFDLGKLIESVVLLLTSRAQEKKITLKAEIDPATPLLLKGDPTRLRQVLLNLITNAIKFTEKGGVTLIVRPENKGNPKSKIYFGVKDTGIGIPKEAQSKIFTPYTQANASITRRFGGTGLGLSICLRLVNAMGDDIKINSEPGQGSTFYFAVPFEAGVAEETPEASPATAQPAAPVKPLRILVVDDNPINQKVVAGFLEKDKHAITPAGSAKEALGALDKSSFDVILMDMEMPEIDGVEAARLIRALGNKEKASVPIIAMTANSGDADIARCLKAGMNDYCAKPIDIDRLRKLLAQVANKEGAFKPGAVTAPATPAAAPAPAPATPAAPASPVFNPEVVDSLKKSMKPAEFDEMMNDLYKKTEELIAAAEKASAEKDVTALGKRGHDIYGMTANFGLNGIAEPAQKLDKRAKSGAPIDELAGYVTQLRPAYEATRKAVDAWAKS